MLDPNVIYRFDFEHPGNLYFSGEAVRGTVVYYNREAMDIQSAYICLEGESRVLFYESQYRTIHGRSVSLLTTYEGSYCYVYARNDVRDAGILPIGVHRFPFKMVLPWSSETSLSERHGCNSYSVSLVLERPWLPDKVYSHFFTVIQLLDLNLHSERLLLPITEQGLVNNCIMRCRSGKVHWSARIPFCGYVPGQEIKYTVKVDNQMKKVDLLGVVVSLFQTFCFKALNVPGAKRTLKKQLLCASVGGPIKRMTKEFYENKVVLPGVQPTTITRSIISVRYSIEFKLYAPKCKGKSEIVLPIQVGTTPLHAVVPCPTEWFRYLPQSTNSPAPLANQERTYEQYRPPSVLECIASGATKYSYKPKVLVYKNIANESPSGTPIPFDLRCFADRIHRYSRLPAALSAGAIPVVLDYGIPELPAEEMPTTSAAAAAALRSRLLIDENADEEPAPDSFILENLENSDDDEDDGSLSNSSMSVPYGREGTPSPSSSFVLPYDQGPVPPEDIIIGDSPSNIVYDPLNLSFVSPSPSTSTFYTAPMELLSPSLSGAPSNAPTAGRMSSALHSQSMETFQRAPQERPYSSLPQTSKSAYAIASNTSGDFIAAPRNSEPPALGDVASGSTKMNIEKSLVSDNPNNKTPDTRSPSMQSFQRTPQERPYSSRPQTSESTNVSASNTAGDLTAAPRTSEPPALEDVATGCTEVKIEGSPVSDTRSQSMETFQRTPPQRPLPKPIIDFVTSYGQMNIQDNTEPLNPYSMRSVKRSQSMESLQRTPPKGLYPPLYQTSKSTDGTPSGDFSAIPRSHGPPAIEETATGETKIDIEGTSSYDNPDNMTREMRRQALRRLPLRGSSSSLYQTPHIGNAAAFPSNPDVVVVVDPPPDEYLTPSTTLSNIRPK